MVSELGEVRFQVAGVSRFDRFGGVAVEPEASCVCQLVVHRVSDQRVPEAKASRLVRHIGNDSLGHRFVQHV